MEDLSWLSVTIALGFLVAVTFYESLSSRDVLVARVRRLTRRLSPGRWLQPVVYVLTVFVLIPGLVLVWTAALAVGLFVVGSVDRVESVATIAVAVVGAARILAYANSRAAHELSKAIPLAFAFLLLTGNDLRLEDKVARLETVPASELGDVWFVFLIALEISMRILTDISHALLSAQRRRLGLDDSSGFWKTLLATVRRRPSQAAG